MNVGIADQFTIETFRQLSERDRHKRPDLLSGAGCLEVRFDITDFQSTVPVVYVGILPDLFDEGQGAVASGELDDAGVLRATEVLAKHDENYMPPEVAEALEKSGYDHKGNAK